MQIPIIPDSKLALFLDVDGTLLEIAETPHCVAVPDSLKLRLHTLSSRLHGAFALVSGRSVETLDRLFAPHRFTAAGIHGSERRLANGVMQYPSVDVERFSVARNALDNWAQQHPGTLLEDKGYALALHYRLAPQFEGAALDAVRRTLPILAGGYELQHGKFVYEMRPAGYSKGVSIQSFMGEPPFIGRSPMFIGDDVTDESGFIAVNRLGGVSVRVGETAETAARYRFPNVDAVVRWLSSL